MKTVYRVGLSFVIGLFILFGGNFLRVTSSQGDDRCVRNCAATNERYHYYVEQLRKGSCQACAHCAAAALYQCVLDSCQLTEAQREEYSEKRDEEIRSAKELGTDCQVK